MKLVDKREKQKHVNFNRTTTQNCDDQTFQMADINIATLHCN